MIQWWQILLLTLYSAYQICDELTIVSSAGSPVFAGFITGLVMGDLTTGLFIGGSLQLFVLGVGTFGGASRIDATSGAVLATAFSVSQGIETDLAITTIAVPVAALLTYFDVLGRMTTTFFAHRIDAAIERFDYKGIERNYLLGAVPWALSRALPVFFAHSKCKFTKSRKSQGKHDNDTDSFCRVHTFLTKQPEDECSEDRWKQTWED